MFRPVMDSSSTNMVQTLASLLQRVQIFGPGTDAHHPSTSPSDSILLPLDAQYKDSNQTIKSSLAKPIPFSGNTLNKEHHFYDESLGSLDYGNSLEESDFERPSFIDEELSSYGDRCDFEDVEDFTQERPGRKRNKSKRENATCLPEISLSEVAQHDMFHDCWMVLYDKVYDVTSFLYEHPGGEELMMEHAGRDGTLAFRSVGHSKAALASLQEYLIGVLPQSERIFHDWENN